MKAVDLYQIGVARLQEAGIPDPEIEASILLCHLLDLSRAELFIYRKDLSESLINAYHELISRRSRREPLAYITGEWEFWSLPFSVTPEVLIPRPETEILIERALNVLADKDISNNKPFRILDMGAGSGIISVVLAKELPGALIYSLDIDRRAQQVARKNARRHDVLERIFFFNADWLQAVRPEPLFDLIVSNPPYVARETFAGLQPEVRDFEPRLALDGGEKGLVEVKRLAGDLAAVLKPGGYFLMEIGADQKDEVIAAFTGSAELEVPEVFNDYAGLPRVFQVRKRENDSRH